MSIQGSAMAQGLITGDNPSPGTSLRRSRLTPSAEKFISHVGTVENDTLVLKRTSVQRNLSPDKVNLDRQDLARVPVFQGEQTLRLLNLQNNAIACIENLHLLSSLIFLDLYGNKITEIAGLEAVPNLRILMLGRNQITTIAGLDHLRELDVLDLHSNSIATMEGVAQLRQLRVLNLADNRICQVRVTGGLSSLTELNLRRNSIGQVAGFGHLRALQRLYLSNNEISTLDSIASVFDAPQLVELSLDNNLVSDSPNYLPAVIARSSRLKQLDHTKISDKMRQGARSERLASATRSMPPGPIRQSPLRPRSAVPTHLPTSAQPSPRATSRRMSADDGRPTPRSGHELTPDGAVLRVVGAGVDVIEGRLNPAFESVVRLEVHDAPIAPIDVTGCRLLNRISALALVRCDIPDLASLSRFAALPRLTDMEIADAAVAGCALLFPFVALMFPRLHTFNRRDVVPDDRHHARSLFAGLTQALGGYTPRLLPPSSLADRQLPFIAALTGTKLDRKAPRRPRPGTSMARLVEAATEKATKIAAVETEWPHLMSQVIGQAVQEHGG